MCIICMAYVGHIYGICMACGFPCGSAGKESTCNAGDLVWSLGWEETLEKGKIPTPVFWPGEFHGLCSAWDRKESDKTEQLSLYVWDTLIDIVTDALKRDKKQMWKVQIKTLRTMKQNDFLDVVFSELRDSINSLLNKNWL